MTRTTLDHKTEKALAALAAGEMTDIEARKILGVSKAKLRGLLQAYEAGHDATPGKSTGRPALHDWPESDIQVLREIYLRTNRADGEGSMSHAIRRLLHEDRRAPAGLRQLTPGTFEALDDLQKRSSSKHYIPTSLRSRLQIAPVVIRHHRSPRNATLSGVYIPGTTRFSSCGTRRLYAGERYSFDDGSQNQVVVVPWSVGGTREADKFGHRTCRGQWLVAHDDATGMIAGWVFTLRPADAYRDPDATGLMYRVGRDVAWPEEHVCEGGVWQSKRAQAFHAEAGIRVINAKGRPHMKLIENWFGRAWTYLSAYEDGQIGRFRGEYERENKLFMRARAGTVDAKEHFPLLTDLLREFNATVDFLNHDPIESREYGRWVPAERWAHDMEAHPRRRMDERLAVYAAPESREVTVRRGGMVVVTATNPLGSTSSYSFADAELARHEGRKVRVLFDPFESVVRAAIFDAQAARQICIAHCMNPPPLPVAEFDWQILRSHTAASEASAVKKAMADAVRTEYRALGAGGRKTSEMRTPAGVTRIDTNLPRDAEVSPDLTPPDRVTLSPDLPPSARAASISIPDWREILTQRAKTLEEKEAAILENVW